MTSPLKGCWDTGLGAQRLPAYALRLHGPLLLDTTLH